MARSQFGGGVEHFVASTYTIGGAPLLRLASAALYAWDAASGGNRLTDLLVDGVAATTITVGADGQVPTFDGPDGVTTLWLSAGEDGDRFRFTSQDEAAVAAARTAAEAARDEAVAAVAEVPATTDAAMLQVLEDDASSSAAAVDARAQALVDALKGAAPAAYDTLVEIASKLDADDDVTATILADLADKVDGADLDTLVAADVNDTASSTRAALSATFGAKPDLLSRTAEPLYIAHRGGKNIYPEHSMDGYRAAAATGFAIELDVHALADGTLVMCHDATVDRTMTGTGNVSALTRDQWLALRINPPYTGSQKALPALWDPVLDEFGGRTLIVAEPKAAGVAQPMIDSVTARGLERAVILQSFTYADAQAAAAAGMGAMFISDAANFSQMIADGIEYLGCSTGAGTSYISDATAAGLKVVVWTVNNRADTSTYFGAGAVGVFSDDPWHVANRYVTRDADRMNVELLPWPHFKQDTYGFWSFQPPNRIRRYSYNWTETVSLPLTWAGTRASKVRVTFTVNFEATAIDQNRWVGMAYGDFLPDANFVDGAANQAGYSVFARRDGRLHVYKFTSGVAPSAIATVAGAAPIAAAGVAGSATLQLEVNATNVILRNLTSGEEATVADASIRVPARLMLNTSGAVMSVSDILVEDL